MNFSATADGRISREMTASRKLKMLNLACFEKTRNPLMYRIKKIIPNKERDNLKMRKLEPGSLKAIMDDANSIRIPAILLLRNTMKTYPSKGSLKLNTHPINRRIRPRPIAHAIAAHQKKFGVWSPLEQLWQGAHEEVLYGLLVA
jgi:hypothetical protein